MRCEEEHIVRRVPNAEIPGKGWTGQNGKRKCQPCHCQMTGQVRDEGVLVSKHIL